MPFKPGVSGNPAGRKPKPKAGPDKLRAKLLAASPEILEALVAQAKAGDTSAAKLVLDRCLPPLRPRDLPVSLPPGQGLADAARALLDALTAGRVTPEEGARIAAVIGTLARVEEIAGLEARLTHIEELLNGQHPPPM